VDPNPLKVQRLEAGESPIVEAGVQERIAAASCAGLISATSDAAFAVEQSEISFISVGTPSQRNGKLDLSHIRKVCAVI
jgi:GDP-mannose 6-dehydrogenase